MARVLLTGAAGFVGLNIVRALAGRGHHVVAFDHRRREFQPRHVEHAHQTAVAHGGHFAPRLCVSLEGSNLLCLKPMRLDALVGIHPEAADAKAEQQPLEEVTRPCNDRAHCRSSGAFSKYPSRVRTVNT